MALGDKILEGDAKGASGGALVLMSWAISTVPDDGERGPYVGLLELDRAGE